MRKLFVLIVLLAIAAAFLAGWQILKSSPEEHAAQIRRESDAGWFVYGFAGALWNNDLEVAKALTVPELWDRIDYWRHASQHRTPFCRNLNWLHDLSEMRFSFVSQRGSTSSMHYLDDTASASAFIGCTYDQFELQVIEASIQRDNHEWIILDWQEICIVSTRGIKICYP
jgi:hypothetical protein